MSHPENQPFLTTAQIDELNDRFRCKEDIYRFLNGPLDFIQRRKAVFRKSEILLYDIPFLPELSIDNNWEMACQIKHFRMYIPDEWTTAKKCERRFFWNILSTLAHDWVVELVKQSHKLRIEARQNKQNQVRMNYVVPQTWADDLLSQPFISSQKNGPLKSLLYKAVQKPRNVRPQKPNLIKLGIRPEDILGTENVHSHQAAQDIQRDSGFQSKKPDKVLQPQLYSLKQQRDMISASLSHPHRDRNQMNLNADEQMQPRQTYANPNFPGVDVYSNDDESPDKVEHEMDQIQPLSKRRNATLEQVKQSMEQVLKFQAAEKERIANQTKNNAKKERISNSLKEHQQYMMSTSFQKEQHQQFQQMPTSVYQQMQYQEKNQQQNSSLMFGPGPQNEVGDQNVYEPQRQTAYDINNTFGLVPPQDADDDENEDMEIGSILQSQTQYQNLNFISKKYSPPKPQAQSQSKRPSLILEGIDGQANYEVYQTPQGPDKTAKNLDYAAIQGPDFDQELNYNLDDLGPLPEVDVGIAGDAKSAAPDDLSMFRHLEDDLQGMNFHSGQKRGLSERGQNFSPGHGSNKKQKTYDPSQSRSSRHDRLLAQIEKDKKKKNKSNKKKRQALEPIEVIEEDPLE